MVDILFFGFNRSTVLRGERGSLVTCFGADVVYGAPPLQPLTFPPSGHRTGIPTEGRDLCSQPRCLYQHFVHGLADLSSGSVSLTQITIVSPVRKRNSTSQRLGNIPVHLYRCISQAMENYQKIEKIGEGERPMGDWSILVDFR